ncbi:MAG: hypothetical protein GY866_42360, partial [Proteobacteria bacterium]|nr:hypothetical protein [Pseudomonadota bacterium]
MLKCDKCGEEATYITRCDEHHKCDDCGARETLCTYLEGVLCNPCHTARVEKRIEEFDKDIDYIEPSGVEELQEALDSFVEDNKELKQFTPDRSTALLIDDQIKEQMERYED